MTAALHQTTYIRFAPMLSAYPFDTVTLPVILDRVGQLPRRSRNPIARLDGLWKGGLRNADGERHMPVSLLMAVPDDGELVARLVFGTPRVEPVELRLEEASSTTWVTMTNPYRDPISGRLQVTSFEGRWTRNRLRGAYLTRPLDGSEMTLGTFSLLRVQIAGW